MLTGRAGSAGPPIRGAAPGHQLVAYGPPSIGLRQVYGPVEALEAA